MESLEFRRMIRDFVFLFFKELKAINHHRPVSMQGTLREKVTGSAGGHFLKQYTLLALA